MYRCENTENGVKGIFGKDEFNAIHHGFFEMEDFFRNKAVKQKIENLRHCFTEPLEREEPLGEEVEIYLTCEEVGDLIAILTYFVPTKDVDVFAELFGESSKGEKKGDE